METIRRSRAVWMLAALLAAVVAITLIWEDTAEARKKKRWKRVWVDQIVFASNQNLNPDDISTDMEIFIIKPDGTGLKQLTHNLVHDEGPVMSPNGAKIAYSHQIPEGSSNREIFVMNRDGSDSSKVQLTDDPDVDWTPDWSPGGTKIAYTNGTGPYSDIWVMNADGSGKAQIYIGPYPQADFRPVFSPDGKKIAFTWGASLTDDFEICEVNSTPGASPFPLCVTNNTTDEFRPEYSPGGSRIYYDSAGPNPLLNSEGEFEVMATTLDSSKTTTNLTKNTTDDLRPSVRRTGTRLVYEKLSTATPPTDSKNSPRFPGTYTSKLSIMDANGNQLGDIPNINSSKTNQSPDWGGYWKRVRR